MLTLFVKFNKYLLTNSLTNLLFMSISISKSNSEELPKDTEQILLISIEIIFFAIRSFIRILRMDLLCMQNFALLEFNKNC